MGWICKYCSTSNEDSETKCIVCDNDKSYGRDRILTSSAVAKLSLTGDVVVPDDFTVIGAQAFANRTDITSVTLHDGVTKIMREAFSGCVNLASVICEKELNSIGEKAFYNCRSLPVKRRPHAQKVAANAFELDTARSTAAKPKPTAAKEPSTEAKEKRGSRSRRIRLGSRDVIRIIVIVIFVLWGLITLISTLVAQASL